MNVNENANLVIRECLIFLEKAIIPKIVLPNCVNKLSDLSQVWSTLQKM